MEGLGFRVWGLGFRVWGSRCSKPGKDCRFRVVRGERFPWQEMMQFPNVRLRTRSILFLGSPVVPFCLLFGSRFSLPQKRTPKGYPCIAIWFLGYKDEVNPLCRCSDRDQALEDPVSCRGEGCRVCWCDAPRTSASVG